MTTSFEFVAGALPADAPRLMRRGGSVLRPDPSRTIFRLFLPGQEVLTRGVSRADEVIDRVLAMPDLEVSSTLERLAARFPGRREQLSGVFAEHFAMVAHLLPPTADITPPRRDLIGAYFTQQYAIEAAALFNPSLVAHPDQSGMPEGHTRFVLSLRAVGEGHVSSLEFRTGVLGPDDEPVLDVPGRRLVTGQPVTTTMSRTFLSRALAELGDVRQAAHILTLLPDQFTGEELECALAANSYDRLTRASDDAVSERIRWIASCNYRLTFPTDHPLSERVIGPTSPDESHGIEDARFTRFESEDGAATYYATYTAFDGSHVTPHLLQTDDFTDFESTRLIGPAAKNKGMALFPRRVGGKYLALSRWDRESIGVASSADARQWDAAATVRTPQQPWELIQLGNCGSPIETDDGWLVFTHGVGPLREYRIGAILLDLEDPTKVIGSSRQPLLTSTGDERFGYVPDVVYSCGGLLHGRTVVLPYGCSDATVRFAAADLAELIAELTADAPGD